MLASLLISAVSLVLLVYWFRYSCLLLLRHEADASAVIDERFDFSHVRERLLTEPNLDPLHRALERDYRIINYLQRHASRLGAQSLEDRMLLLDYKLMRHWYSLTRTAAPRQARQALDEMATVLACVARRMGEQAGVRAQI